jgi:hypothetical protein
MSNTREKDKGYDLCISAVYKVLPPKAMDKVQKIVEGIDSIPLCTSAATYYPGDRIRYALLRSGSVVPVTIIAYDPSQRLGRKCLCQPMTMRTRETDQGTVEDYYDDGDPIVIGEAWIYDKYDPALAIKSGLKGRSWRMAMLKWQSIDHAKPIHSEANRQVLLLKAN